MLSQIGVNFGPIGASVFPVNAPFATYGGVYNASCVVTQASRPQVLVCVTAEGAGAGLMWTVTIGGQTSPTAPNLTNYASPTISSIGASSRGFLTTGGEIVIVQGNNFGPSGAPLIVQLVRAGGLSLPLVCNRTNHTVINCTSPEGAGLWTLVVTVTEQNNSNSVAFSYEKPNASSLSIADGTAIPTNPTNFVFNVSGSSFGVNTTWNQPLVVVSPVSLPQLQFTCNCQVSIPHVQLSCVLAAGIGAALTWTPATLGLSGDPLATTISYESPVVTHVDPPVLPTFGASLTVYGTGTTACASSARVRVHSRVDQVQRSGFGPAGVPFHSIYMLSYAVQLNGGWNNTNCTVFNGTSMVCANVYGVGSGHSLYLTVGLQASNSVGGAFSLSFLSPSILGINPLSVPTSGGTFTLTGDNFGPPSSFALWDSLDVFVVMNWGAAVHPCTVSNASLMTCVAAEGIGGPFPVTVTVAGQSSESNQTVHAAYDTPDVTTPPSNIGTARGGVTVTVAGR